MVFVYNNTCERLYIYMYVCTYIVLYYDKSVSFKDGLQPHKDGGPGPVRSAPQEVADHLADQR